MWELDHKQSWALKNWCFWTVVLLKTLESPLDYKEIQPVHSEDEPWDFFGRNDAKAETPVLRPPHVKCWLIGKDSDAGRDWGQDEKGMTENEMAWWHHWLDGRESEWTPRVGDGQGGLVCCDSWGCKESDTTERLNWTELIDGFKIFTHENYYVKFKRWLLECMSNIEDKKNVFLFTAKWMNAQTNDKNNGGCVFIIYAICNDICTRVTT